MYALAICWVTKEVASDVYLSAKRLFGDGPVVGGDDLDEVLARGKGKKPVVLGDEISEMRVNGDSVDGDAAPFVIGRGGAPCAGGCGPRMEAIMRSLGRMEAMLGMLMPVSGLASPEERLAAEKRKGRMARECDVSMARATERAKSEELVKVAEKRARKKAVEDERAEEALVYQEEWVKVKEAARVAAVAERDRVVEAVKGVLRGRLWWSLPRE